MLIAASVPQLLGKGGQGLANREYRAESEKYQSLHISLLHSLRLSSPGLLTPPPGEICG